MTMQSKVTEIKFEIELQPGEEFSLPKDATGIIGPGHWLVCITAANQATSHSAPRDHSAFLNSYAPEDEGLYDDYQAG
jgi:hypothetical protein